MNKRGTNAKENKKSVLDVNKKNYCSRRIVAYQ